MQETDDQLLTRFAKHRDDSAFGELTSRYLGLIYHVALRRTGNRQMSEEVSQNVLCVVASKAAGLARHPERLPAWLHRATLFESTKAMRSEASHQRRKKLVHPDSIAITGDDETSNWKATLPHLDLALDRLSDSDRTVVLRHYFEEKSFDRIAIEFSRPPATVQKQCRRAVEKLARILRRKGLTLSVTTLASGLGTQSAKAAPAMFLKTAATKALAGAASHSTISLALFMSIKSKTFLPIALLLLASPLVLQQLAISRASDHIDRLSKTLVSTEPGTRRTSRTTDSRFVSTGKRRITIDMLQRAQEEAERSALKQIEFQEMFASLGSEELAALIPQALNLPVMGDQKMNLFRLLIETLAAIDPGKAFKAVCEVDLDNISIKNTGVHRVLFAWASESPDEAVEYFKNLTTTYPDDSGLKLLPLKGAVVAALILGDSPRIREILTLPDQIYPAYALRDAISHLRSNSAVNNNDSATAVFSKFLPWAREFVPADSAEKSGSIDRAQVIQSLLFEFNQTGQLSSDPVPGKIMDSVELLDSERLIIGEFHIQTMLGSLYDNQPNLNRAEVETPAHDWLATHLPEEAEEIFKKSNSIVVNRERWQIEQSLRDLTNREIIRDIDIIQELDQRDFSEFPDFLPQALEQAARIKDSAKRAKMIEKLQITKQ